MKLDTGIMNIEVEIMIINKIELFAVAIITLPMILVLAFNSSAVNAGSDDDEAALLYKKKSCFACHKADASKHFDPAKTDEELAETVMKGKKGEKPPFMPAFETKGVTAEQATALVAHMKKLAKPGS